MAEQCRKEPDFFLGSGGEIKIKPPPFLSKKFVRLTEMIFSRRVKKLVNNELLRTMGQVKDTLVKLKCSVCSRITHYTKRNKKKVKEKLALSKYCRFCRKNTGHTESK